MSGAAMEKGRMADSRPTTILFADDHPLVLNALKGLVGADETLRPIHFVCDGLAAISALEKDAPDVAVVDMRMPGLSGLKFLEEVRSRNLPVRVILFTAEMNDEEICDAVSLGVDSILFKRSAPENLLDCIHKVAVGNRCFPDESIAAAVDRQRQQRERMDQLLPRLSPRETAIATMAAKRMSNKEIAKALDITEGTVKVHLHNIFLKLGLSDRSALRTLLSPVVEPSPPLSDG
ncbi:response regulator [Sinorhizobium alkalisoli]|nr:response regulator transcription factor [Sinorhizobium alkalisoli]